jgi:hypothetical protein
LSQAILTPPLKPSKKGSFYNLIFDIDKFVTSDTVSSIMPIKLSLVDGARMMVESLINPETKLEKEE